MNSEIRESFNSVKDAIKETKQYLNHEFRNYYKNVVYLEPKEWLWVTKPFLLIENEKPNLPTKLAERCIKLYIDIFEAESNRFIDYNRQLLKIRKEGASEKEISKIIWIHYDKWRTEFTVEANSIIQIIDEKLKESINNETGSNKDLKVLKNMISESKLKEVVDILINEYDLNRGIQNQLYEIAYRLNEINNQVITDTVDFSTSRIEKNKIAISLLKIIDKIK